MRRERILESRGVEIGGRSIRHVLHARVAALTHQSAESPQLRRFRAAPLRALPPDDDARLRKRGLPHSDAIFIVAAAPGRAQNRVATQQRRAVPLQREQILRVAIFVRICEASRKRISHRSRTENDPNFGSAACRGREGQMTR